jgi:hypothetical protein
MGHPETLNPDRIQIQDPDSYLILYNDSSAEPDTCPYYHMFVPVLRIRDPVLFLPRDPGLF